ncbi:hypothetical protein CALVIDRAFT_539052 [Calocera viscosa TUFC12733]|uniref:Pex19-domain-containing protein n=1 Tax=Calocera viscosa (strain TUFC12733) TaxID=1330018 RepID=A0A167K610_CALVF|nr:hypothetical protein CALVIDRAFT_539052 [Calocera viscosa TUFC12733]
MPDPPSTSKAPAVEISDDLDDLDDILDDFSPAPVPPPAPSTIPPPPSRPAPTPPSSSAPGGGGGGDADFLNQMLRSMSSEPSEEPLTQEEQDELQRLTQMFGRLGGDFDLGSLTEEGQEGEEDDAQARSTAQALSSMFSMLQDLPPEELMRQLQAAEGQEGMPDISSTLRELDLGDLGGAWGDPDGTPSALRLLIAGDRREG